MADKLCVQKFKGQISNLIVDGIFFHQRADGERLAFDDPVIAHIAEDDWAFAAVWVWHIVGNNDLVTENRIVGAAPEVIARTVLERPQMKRCAVVHHPDGILPVFPCPQRRTA